MDHTTITSIIIALTLGAAVGFERESNRYHTDTSKTSGRGDPGVRSYALVSLLGVLSGIVYPSFFGIFVFIAGLFGVIVGVYYILGSLQTKDPGFTTELAITLTFLLSVLLGLGALSTQLIIALTVVIIMIMSLKTEIQTWIKGIRMGEVDAFVSFALIALVILPFLPNTAVTLQSIPALASMFALNTAQTGTFAHLEILNPYALWRIVVIITGIDVAGYILQKTVGQKNSWLLTSLAGGFISSTSTTQSLAIRSKSAANYYGLIAAATVANTSSFVQHAILLLSINPALFIRGLPYLLALIVSGTLVTWYFFMRGKSIRSDDLQSTRKSLDHAKIFALKPALVFAFLFTGIKFISKVMVLLFGQNGLYLAAGVAAWTGMDIVTLTVGDIAGKTVPLSSAIAVLIFANAINLTAKTVYSFAGGSKRFAVGFGKGALVIISATMLSVLFIR